MNPIYKFNNGRGATLCNQCSVIISVGLTDDLYCKDCRKEMEKQQSFADVNRVEVIQHSPPYNGRVYTNYDAKDVELQLQDNNKTLKIFLK